MPDIGQQDRIIALYEAMSGVTSAMLAAARGGNWDTLVTLETESAAHMATLRREEPQQTLSRQQSQRKGELVTRMLAADGEIRTLAAARMVQLSHLMDDASTQRKLSKTYQA